MDQLLNTNNKKIEINEFDTIINQTEQQFYRENNDSCVAHGSTDDDLFAIMKNDTIVNEQDNITVKLNLKNNTIQKFINHHNKQIKSLIYYSDGNTLITASVDHSICLYNSTTGILIKKFVEYQGTIMSLLLKSNILFVGGCSVVSMYKFHVDNNDNNSTVSDMSLIEHFLLSSDSENKNYVQTFTECGHFDFWLGVLNSNKIFHLSIDKNNISKIISKLIVI